jgi:hypothetical protein
VDDLSFFDTAIRAEAKKLDAGQGRAFHLTGAIRDRYYWVNLLNELNNNFTDDNIWITQLTPIPKNGRDKVTEQLIQGSGSEPEISIPQDSEVEEKVVNAVHLQGLYHNKGGSAKVSLFFENLLKSDYFDIDAEQLEDNRAQFLKMDTGSDGDHWAWRWEMYLPLAREIPYQLQQR